MSLTIQTDERRLLAHEEGSYTAASQQVEEKIEFTTRSIVTASTYACRLCYIYNCIHDTTFGSEILACVISSRLIKFLQSWAKFQKIFFYKGIFALMVFLGLAVQVAYIVDLDKAESDRFLPFILDSWLMIYIFSVPTGLCFLMMLVDLFIFLVIDQRIQVAFSACLAFPVDFRMDHLNEFVKHTTTETQTIVHTDLSTHILGARLQSSAQLEVMFYVDRWRVKYLWGDYKWMGGHFPLPGITYAFVFVMYFLCIIWYHCLGVIIENEPESYAGQDVAKEDSIAFVSLGAPIFIILWAKYFSILVFYLLALPFWILNFLLCKLPEKFIWRSYIDGIDSRMRRQIQEGGRGQAPQIPRKIYTLKGY